MLKRFLHIALFFFVFLSGLLPAHAQPAKQVPKAENGWYMSPHGQIHILVVYAEIDFDSSYGNLDPVKTPEGTIGWKKGRLPNWKQAAVGYDSESDAWMTKYFRQASFGDFKVTGDVLDTLISIPISSIRDQKGNVVQNEAYASYHYKQAVVRKLNSIQQPRFLFGSKIEEFDRWTFNGYGQKQVEKPNGSIDLIMVVWRNIHVIGLGEMSGFVSPGSFGEIWGRPTDMYSMFKTESMLPTVIMRHEFSHMLYGGNNFHTANGGVGSRTFISTVGGYSNMSASDAMSGTWNGWDRERLGWQHPANQYLLSARCPENEEEIDGDLVYGQAICNDGIVVLRDFVSTGDVIKIKLPHLPGHVRNQYLWLENHQMLPGMVDHDKAVTKGLYAYIQVGKDLREGERIFDGVNNYIWPLVAQGHYDFDYDAEKNAYFMWKQKANPLTGYSYFARHVMDVDGDGKIRITTDVTPKTEYVFPSKLFVEGKEMPEEFCSWKQYPQFGTKEVSFRHDLYPKIGISYNPSPTPVYSHSGTAPQRDDNRRIYLNGISIEVLEALPNGELKLQIRWDDFDIVDNLRWCGDIVLKEKLHITRNHSISLDQGWSVQVAKAVQELDGKNVFAEPTILELDSGSVLELEKFGQIWVKPGSSLFVRKGAKISFADYSGIIVERGGHIFVEDGAIISKTRKSRGIVWADRSQIQDLNPMFKARIEGLSAQNP